MRRFAFIFVTVALLLVAGCESGKVPAAASEQAEIAIKAAENYLNGEITASSAAMAIEGAAEIFSGIDVPERGSTSDQLVLATNMAKIQLAFNMLEFDISMIETQELFRGEVDGELIAELKNSLEEMKDAS